MPYLEAFFTVTMEMISASYKHCKMTEEEEKKKATMKNTEEEKQKTCGNAELLQAAEERGEKMLVNFSDSLELNPADVERKQANIQGRPVSDEQPEGGDCHELPVQIHLFVQRYDGEMVNGHFHGEGVAYFEGGHIYQGMFSKGLMDGHGVFTQTGGLKYEGEFVCNNPMGQGTYTWPDGSSYKGEVYNGIRHGTGTYKCAKTGFLFKGQWDQGKRHGKGTVYYNQDKTSWYKGDWVKNSREGWGVRCYPSGNTYSGEWKNNQRHGEGTMRWLNLDQQYVGMWQNGIQHGRGTHIWNLGFQNSQSNQYIGDFVQGRRHGKGTFYYAGGAIYEGEWSNNKRHSKGKFTFEDGCIFEGELVDDQLLTHNMNGSRALIPLCGAFPLSSSDAFVLGADMALNIEYLLDLIPQTEWDTELKQVEFAVLMQSAELRSVYSFYSRLGHVHTANNSFLLSRLQLWRLLKDCFIHHQGFTLTQIDHFIKEDATAAEIHSPFTPMLLHRFISCLVVVAYHLYCKDMVSQKNLLAACFYKLMTDNILPDAKNLKGFLFKQPHCAVVAVNYLKKSWEIYEVFCKVNTAHKDEQTMTYRQLLLMFKDLHLLDNNLTTVRLLEIITAESCDPSNLSSCLSLEITFLEFFEVLLGSAGVKCQLDFEGLNEDKSLSSPDTKAKRNLPKEETTEKILQTANSPFQSVEASVNSNIIPEISSPKSVQTKKSQDTAQDIESQQEVKAEVNEELQSVGHTGDDGVEGKDMKTRGVEVKDWELELQIQTIHQFFKHFFFPAFEHHQLVSRYMREENLNKEPDKRGTQKLVNDTR